MTPRSQETRVSIFQKCSSSACKLHFLDPLMSQRHNLWWIAAAKFQYVDWQMRTAVLTPLGLRHQCCQPTLCWRGINRWDVWKCFNLLQLSIPVNTGTQLSDIFEFLSKWIVIVFLEPTNAGKFLVYTLPETNSLPLKKKPKRKFIWINHQFLGASC